MDEDTRMKDLHVLLVDDDEDVREFLAMSLEIQDVKATQVADAESAMEALTSGSFDAVATDMNLPGADGISLLRHIREKYDDLPVILITGYGSVDSAVDALKMGAQDYLVKPLETADGLLGAIWKAVDRHKLTKENRALQERLVRAKKMESLADLAGGVAHDLNNILAPMLGLPDIIIDEIRHTCDTCHERLIATETDLELMKTSAQRAAAMVRDLTASTKRGNCDLRPVSINKVVDDFIRSQEFMEMIKPRDDVEFTTDLCENPRLVSASQPHLIRAISNLVRNSLEAMNEQITGTPCENPSLSVTTSLVSLQRQKIGYEIIAPGDYAVVPVSDTGMGMEKEYLDRIFEPFFTRKKQSRQSGSGLGLSVVHGVVKDHEGYVDVVTKPGEGASISLYFPVTESAAIPQPQPTPVSGGTEHVLVIDDEPAPRIVAERFLKKLGYEVTAAISGRNALGLIKKACKGDDSQPFDLILLDMVMEEDFDGLATFHAIRELCPGQKAVICSGYAPTDRTRTALNMGAGWLPKPYTMNDLASVLRHELDGEKAPAKSPSPEQAKEQALS